MFVRYDFCLQYKLKDFAITSLIQCLIKFITLSKNSVTLIRGIFCAQSSRNLYMKSFICIELPLKNVLCPNKLSAETSDNYQNKSFDVADGLRVLYVVTLALSPLQACAFFKIKIRVEDKRFGKGIKSRYSFDRNCQKREIVQCINIRHSRC